GPSGSGKSTLYWTTNRLEPVHSGEIMVNGRLLPREGRDLAPGSRGCWHGAPVVQPVRAQDDRGERDARADQGARRSAAHGPGAARPPEPTHRRGERRDELTQLFFAVAHPTADTADPTDDHPPGSKTHT